MVEVKDLKDVVIFLKMMFLALSFVMVLETVAIYKFMLLIDSYVFLGYLRSIFSLCELSETTFM